MFALINLLITFLFIFDTHPIIKSALTGEYHNSVEISTPAKVFRLIQMAHLLFTIVMGIVMKIYEQIKIVTLDTTTISFHILAEILYIPIVVIPFYIITGVAITLFNFTRDVNVMIL